MKGMRKVRIILQARTSSSRLPAKVLLPISGIPMSILSALRLGNTGHEVILATSKDISDDYLAYVAESYGVKVFRGSLNNVLDRYVSCSSDLHVSDVIVRATADNIFPDGHFINQLLDKYEKLNEDYLGTHSPKDGLPYGLGAEVFTVRNLRNAQNDNPLPDSLEHVTSSMRKKAGKLGIIKKFSLINQDLSDMRLTVDTLEDYIYLTSVLPSHSSIVSLSWDVLLKKILHNDSDSREIFTIVNDESKDSNNVDITLGTVQFGLDYGITNTSGKPTDKEIDDILSLAYKENVKYLDTARAYGDSENQIGRYLSKFSTENFEIITKISSLDCLHKDAKESEIFNAIDANLYRSFYHLGRKKIEVLMLHNFNDMVRWNGKVLNRLLDFKGSIIGAIGVSVYSPEEAIIALKNLSITHIQIPFNILDKRWLDVEFQKSLTLRPDVLIHVRSAFLQGLLVNSLQYWPNWIDNREKIFNTISKLTSDFERVNKMDLCLAYVRSFSWVSSIVVGTQKSTQLQEILNLQCHPPLKSKQVKLLQSAFQDIVPDRLLTPNKW